MKWLLLFIPFMATAQLRISGNGHYLYEKQTGLPVFLNGESAWGLINATTYTQADTFFQNCQTYGINFIECQLIERGLSGSGPTNQNGHKPFATKAFQSAETEAYFTHVDSIVGLAKRYNIYLHLYISYLGSNSTEGWLDSISAASTANMQSWGTWVGTRYKDSTNIMWGISGDTDPTSVRTKLDSMTTSLWAADTNHYATPRDDPATTTQTNWSGRWWCPIDYVYPYWGPQTYTPGNIVTTNWTIYGTNRPAFLSEAWYEGEHQYPTGSYPTDEQVRRQMYYASPITGSMGQVFGNCPVWHFSTNYRSICATNDYRTYLGSQGHISMKWIGKLVRNRRWWTFVPDNGHVAMTSGYGSGDTQAICAYASDSSTIMAHSPVSLSLTITSVKLKSADSLDAWWFNPSDGSTTYIGRQARGSHVYATGGENVLVLDAVSMGFPAPGLDTTATGATIRQIRAHRR
jgi:hypothetical protein